MRAQTRWQRRDRKHQKAQHGMRMDGKSTKTVLARLATATSPARRRRRK